MKAFLALFLAVLSTAPVRAAERPPNIVMIISDDQGWGDYGFLGHAKIKTPHLDRLAAQSLVFPRGYVPSSLCCPSLASIITGQYPHQHKITSNDPPYAKGGKKGEKVRDPEFRAGREKMNGYMRAAATLPRTLAQRGYVSLQTGKWWQGHYSSGGFTHGMSTDDPGRGGRHGDEGLTIGRQTMQPVYSFIAEAAREQKPFFVWYAPMLPHTPHNPPARLLDKYRDQAPTLQVAKYWAMIEWFDETCGQLLAHLDGKGLAENTIVVYVTDNGWIQNPEADRFDARSKQSPYDGGVRTPIMIHWPGKVTPRRSEALASSIDLCPTLLAAAGIQPAGTLPGINLLDDAAVSSRERIFGEIFTHDAVDLDHPASSLRFRWVVEGNWKLIVPAPRNEPDARVQLYDLVKDPEEKNDLAAREPERVAKLTETLNTWWPGK
ncbi:MAG: sulfatase [Verrucomicrobiota bacterium]|nr:sulfatase [Verrucomicrobiota bacterium]